MTTKLKASLEAVINDWFISHTEDEGWPQAYIQESIVEDMTSAAVIVFDASFSAGKAGEENASPSA